MRIPVWVTLAVAVFVIGFGAYRIKMGLSKPAPEAEEPKRTGLYRMSKRMHLFIGIIYLLLGAGLVATSFGWNPFGDSIGPDTEKPSPSKAPTKTQVPLDQTK